jgi:hypothetical protein
MQVAILPAPALPASLPGMRILPLILLVLLAGCELVDQRTVARWFGGRPTSATVTDVAAAALPALPLVTVRFDQPDADYTSVLSAAAQDAMQRKSSVVFEVITPVPTAAPRAEQDAFVRRGAGDARAVADALATAGVPPDQIRLGLRGDPGQPVREVRVYVR